MTVRSIQRFEVSLKAFVVRDRRVLLLREADTGLWELPGGRIDVGEEFVPQADVLAREIREELGADFTVEIGAGAVTWVRRRPTDGVHQFLVARICPHVGGEPVLSAEHDRSVWATREELATYAFPPESGYLTGLARLAQLAAL
jgi:8-oxo-dGTP pyrophosphatase MutT (NUDIX family)